MLRERNHLRKRAHIGIQVVEDMLRIAGAVARRAIQGTIDSSVIHEIHHRRMSHAEIKSVLVRMDVRRIRNRIARVDMGKVQPA